MKIDLAELVQKCSEYWKRRSSGAEAAAGRVCSFQRVWQIEIRRSPTRSMA
jgi:hypothetical protein